MSAEQRRATNRVAAESTRSEGAGTRAALDWISDAFVALDRRLCVAQANRHAVALFACPLGTLLDRPLSEAFPEDQRETLDRECAVALREQVPRQRTEYVSGWQRWIEYRLHPTPDGLLVFLQDVTERRRTELQNRRRERELTTLVEHSPDVLLRLGLDGTILFASAAVRRFLDAPASGVIGRRLHELGFPPAQVERWQRLVQHVAQRGTVRQLAFPLDTVDGTRYLDARITPEIEFGEVTTVMVVLRDVSTQLQAVAQLREREERFRALVEHASDLIAILDERGTICYASPAYQHVLGRSPDELLDQDAFSLVHPDDLAAAQRAFAEALRAPGQTLHPFPLRFRHRDHGWRSFDVLLTNLLDDDAVCGVVVNSRDVTEQELLTVQLRQAQKMEALGQLAGGVAHDFNNVLAAVTGFTQLVLDQLPDGDARRTDLLEVLGAADRGAGVARQLLAFARPALGTPSAATEVALSIRELARMLRPLLPSSIGIALNLPADSAWVRIDRTQLDQLLMNLALNARDAMPDGGRLTLSVRLEFDAPGTVTILVTDTGVGMTPEVRTRIFEPFFTTKPPGIGTGLGLATAYGIARRAGGRVRVESLVGHGSSFAVVLPRASAPEPSAPARASSSGPGADRPVVLLVDDEDGVRRSTARLLEAAGFAVVTAEHGAAAWRELEARGNAVSLVLTDATMPELGGRELASRIARRWPGMPVVLMSGYESDTPAAARGPAAATAAPVTAGAGAPAADGAPSRPVLAAVLEKPFSGERLVTTLRAALAR